MITHAPCHWCDQPLHLTLDGWKHPDGQTYAQDGHCATPDRDKISREDKRAGLFPASPSRARRPRGKRRLPHEGRRPRGR